MIFNLLIVDDEPEIVDWLYELFTETESLELNVFKAYSAREALAWLDRTKIDVVLSDIRMPGMSGLQLLEKINEGWPQCRVIFLSGFREFDYVYSAIQKHSVSYLLKTEDDDKIMDTVRQAISDIEESLRDEAIVERANEQMKLAMPILQKEWLTDLLEGYMDSFDHLQQRLHELDIPFDAEKPVHLVIGRLDSLPAGSSRSQQNKLLFSLRSISEQLLPGKCHTLCIHNEPYNLIWLIQPQAVPEREDVKKYSKFAVSLQGALEYIQRSCQKSLDTTVSFGVSMEPVTIPSISSRYRSLNRLLGYRSGLGKQLILTEANSPYADPADTNDSPLRRELKLLGRVKELDHYLESGRRAEGLEFMHTLLDKMKQISSRNYHPALEIYFSVSVLLLSYINRWELTERLGEGTDLHLLTRVDEHPSWEAAVQYLISLTEKLFELQQHEEEQRTSDTVTELQQYILAQLQEDLSLVKLADMVHLNPSYLSRLFKQATGMNVSDYILEKRIDRAKELLRDTNLKINEIAESVGYRSSHSFARFFRNSAGASPQEYRDSFLKSKRSLQK